jgi:phage gp29-like protein
MPEQSAIEFVEAKSTGSSGALPHPALITFCNAEISKLVLGNTMTTEQGDRGARSLGEVYERAEDDMTATDCSNLARTIRRDLLTPIVGFNLGWDWPIPEVRFVAEEQADLEKESRIDEVLVTKVKLPLGQKYFYERYGRPQPEDGEELVSGPPAPVIAPPPGQPPGEPDEDAEPDETASSKTSRGMRVLSAEKKSSQAWAVRMTSSRGSLR